jgi:type II secretory pathway component PulM
MEVAWRHHRGRHPREALLVSWAVLATLSLTSYIRVVTLLSKLILE